MEVDGEHVRREQRMADIEALITSRPPGYREGARSPEDRFRSSSSPEYETRHTLRRWPSRSPSRLTWEDAQHYGSMPLDEIELRVQAWRDRNGA